ncbi:cupin-like domain-containing protein [Piscinibacter sp.]|uniref:cupin-like domain-containing protein n=1 Tax=Piscinibacter sp. TaxID=1903157 RepID=UPI0039E3AEC8
MQTALFQDIDAQALDRAPLKFRHAMMDHPALSLSNLAQVIPALPAAQVKYATNRLSVDQNFEQSFGNANATLEETIEKIRESDSYIMVRAPESHPSFQPLYRELLADTEAIMRAKGVGAQAHGAMLYMFIASPNSVTPFHIDRYSTFLFQFRGSKTVTIFPQWDERVVTHRQRESYIAYDSTELGWTPEMDQFGMPYSFAPGEALHIPFAAGHHVRNGADDVSISLSIIFNTDETRVWRSAHEWNHWARQRGFTPAPVPGNPSVDRLKALSRRVTNKMERVVRRPS